MKRLKTYPRSAYPTRAPRVAKIVGARRTTPDQRGWGQLPTGPGADKKQRRKNVELAVVRPRDGRTFKPELMADLAPLGQLLMDIVTVIGAEAPEFFEWRGAQESADGGIGSFYFRDIRESDEASWHSWCVALDLMTGGSPRDFRWRSVIPPWVVELFERAGFGWGGRWGDGKKSKYDPHHFEYLFTPADVARDIENALRAAAEIAKRFGIALPARFLPAGQKPDPKPDDPDPRPPAEDDMPKITTPLVGHEAVIGDQKASTTVRSRPSPAKDAVTRSFPKGQTETWTVVGWVTGEHSSFGNSDQWLAHVTAEGAWEYTAKGNVQEVRPPAITERIAALEAAAGEDMKAMHGALTHLGSAKALLEERIR